MSGIWFYHEKLEHGACHSGLLATWIILSCVLVANCEYWTRNSIVNNIFRLELCHAVKVMWYNHLNSDTLLPLFTWLFDKEVKWSGGKKKYHKLLLSTLTKCHWYCVLKVWRQIMSNSWRLGHRWQWGPWQRWPRRQVGPPLQTWPLTMTTVRARY